jgi:putative transposase
LIAYVDEHKQEYGVEPICRVLTEAGAKIAPSTYYAAKSRPPSARTVADALLDERIVATHAATHAQDSGTTGSARCGRR